MIFALSGIEYYFRKNFTVGQLFDGVAKGRRFLMESGNVEVVSLKKFLIESGKC